MRKPEYNGMEFMRKKYREYREDILQKVLYGDMYNTVFAQMNFE